MIKEKITAASSDQTSTISQDMNQSELETTLSSKVKDTPETSLRSVDKVDATEVEAIMQVELAAVDNKVAESVQTKVSATFQANAASITQKKVDSARLDDQTASQSNSAQEKPAPQFSDQAPKAIIQQRDSEFSEIQPADSQVFSELSLEESFQDEETKMKSFQFSAADQSTCESELNYKNLYAYNYRACKLMSCLFVATQILQADWFRKKNKWAEQYNHARHVLSINAQDVEHFFRFGERLLTAQQDDYVLTWMLQKYNHFGLLFTRREHNEAARKNAAYTRLFETTDAAVEANTSEEDIKHYIKIASQKGHPSEESMAAIPYQMVDRTTYQAYLVAHADDPLVRKVLALGSE